MSSENDSKSLLESVPRWVIYASIGVLVVGAGAGAYAYLNAPATTTNAAPPETVQAERQKRMAARRKRESTQALAKKQESSSSSSVESSSDSEDEAPKQPRRIKISEVEEHDEGEDLWLIIDGKVYDVTDFVEKHPGGRDALINVAGTDATAKFNGIGAHDDEAKQKLESMYIGHLSSD